VNSKTPFVVGVFSFLVISAFFMQERSHLDDCRCVIADADGGFRVGVCAFEDSGDGPTFVACFDADDDYHTSSPDEALPSSDGIGPVGEDYTPVYDECADSIDEPLGWIDRPALCDWYGGEWICLWESNCNDKLDDDRDGLIDGDDPDCEGAPCGEFSNWSNGHCDAPIDAGND
jgi:hypothetical protein